MKTGILPSICAFALLLLIYFPQEGRAQCLSAPTALGAAAVSTTSANIFWTTGGATNWVVEYGPKGFTLGTGTTVYTSNNPLTLMGLTSNLHYDFYVRDSCGIGLLSPWSLPGSVASVVTPCDNFDIYSTGLVGPQSSLINEWAGGGGDAAISTDYASSGTKSLKIHTSGINAFSDVLADIGIYNSGIHNIKFDFYIPTGNGGYYNILHNYVGSTGSVWAIEVTLGSNGVATIEMGSNATGTIGTYNFTPGAWNTVEHIVDLTNDTAYIFVNGVDVNVGWDFSLGSTNYGYQFNAVNFYSTAPTGQTPLMYFDDFCITPAHVNDVGLVEFLPPASLCGDSAFAVEAVIRNFSDVAISGINVNIDITGTTSGNFTYTYPGTLAARSADTVTVLYANNYAGGTFNIAGYTTFSGDTDLTNDTTIVNNVTIFPNPAVDLGADFTYCSNENLSVTLNAQNAGSTYLWNTSATTQTVTVNAAGTYAVLVTNSFGCTDQDTVVVTELIAPSVTLQNEDICIGDSVMLDAGNAGASFQWSVAGETGQTLWVNTSGNYGVKVTSSNGCSDSTGAIVTVHPLPVVDLGNDTSIVAGTTITLDAGNPGSNYEWSVSGETSQTLTVTTPGEYSVTVTSAQGCVSADTINIEEGIGIEELLTGQIKIYPNITESISNIELWLNMGGGLNIEIYALNGQMIEHHSYELSAAKHTIPVDMSNYSKGMYILRVRLNDRPAGEFKVTKL